MQVSSIPRARIDYVKFVDDFHTRTAFYLDHPERIPKELDWENEACYPEKLAKRRRLVFDALFKKEEHRTPRITGILEAGPPSSLSKQSLSDLAALNITRGTIRKTQIATDAVKLGALLFDFKFI